MVSDCLAARLLARSFFRLEQICLLFSAVTEIEKRFTDAFLILIFSLF